MLALFLFKERNSTDVSEQQGDENGSVNCFPSVWQAARNDEDTPPHEDFPHVVRVATVLPQTVLDEFALLCVRVCNMSCELLISHSFHQKAGSSNAQPNEISPAKRLSRGVSSDKSCGSIDKA